MFATIKQDYMGCLHIWPGKVHPIQRQNTCIYTVKGEECPIFFQSQSDIELIEERLTKQQIKDLNNGWAVKTKRISDIIENLA